VILSTSATDGNFYGAAEKGGNGYESFFQITPKGTLYTQRGASRKSRVGGRAVVWNDE